MSHGLDEEDILAGLRGRRAQEVMVGLKRERFELVGWVWVSRARGERRVVLGRGCSKSRQVI